MPRQRVPWECRPQEICFTPPGPAGPAAAYLSITFKNEGREPASAELETVPIAATCARSLQWGFGLATGAALRKRAGDRRVVRRGADIAREAHKRLLQLHNGSAVFLLRLPREASCSSDRNESIVLLSLRRCLYPAGRILTNKSNSTRHQVQ